MFLSLSRKSAEPVCGALCHAPERAPSAGPGSWSCASHDRRRCAPSGDCQVTSRCRSPLFDGPGAGSWIVLCSRSAYRSSAAASVLGTVRPLSGLVEAEDRNVGAKRAGKHNKTRGSHRVFDVFPSLCGPKRPCDYRAWLGRRRPGRKRDHHGVKPLPRTARGPISGSRPRIGWNIPVDRAAGVSAGACASCSLGNLAAEPTIFMRPPLTNCFRNVEIMFCCTK